MEEIRCDDCDSSEYIRRHSNFAPFRHCMGIKEDGSVGYVDRVTEEEFEAEMQGFQNDKLAFDTELAARKCEKCGGQMRLGLAPKCPACGTRDAELDRTAFQTNFD